MQKLIPRKNGGGGVKGVKDALRKTGVRKGFSLLRRDAATPRNEGQEHKNTRENALLSPAKTVFQL